MISLPIIVPLVFEETQTVFNLALESNQQMVALQSECSVNPVIYDAPTYDGAYVIDPSAHNAIILETKDKICTDDITVNKIKTSQTTNPYGTTFYIAEVS